METRSRKVPGISGSMVFGASAETHLGLNWDSIPVETAGYNFGEFFPGEQITSSEEHPDWNGKRGSGEQNIGGEFSTIKRSIVGLPPYASVITNRVRYWPWGQKVHLASYFWPNLDYLTGVPIGTTHPEDPKSSDAELNAQGTTAISRCVPTNPIANAGQALGEIGKDGLPSLPLIHSLKRRTLIAKRAGGEFLNHVFGWMPLLSDIGETSSAVLERQRLLKQFERDSGRIVRRGFRFPSETDTKVEVIGGVQIQPLGKDWWQYWIGSENSVGILTKEVTTTRDVWFSGAFTYYLPAYSAEKESVESAIKAKHLLGLELTPSLLWELAPWSWLADWVTNTGDLINNVTQFSRNGLVMRWGYIMEHCVQDITYKWTMVDPSSQIPPGSLTLRVETKNRRAASPYGFGVDLGGLSAFQLSVLAALGISRK